MSTGTMRAAILEQYGDAKQFQVIENAPQPRVAHNQVKIEVKACAINPLDWKFRNGSLKYVAPFPRPMVLGSDIAGIVSDVGSSVTQFAPGDEVFCMMDANSKPAFHGFAKPGGYAQFAVTREDTLAIKPKCLTFEEAATFPLAALTAYQALNHTVTIGRQSRVLINGASGGVGSFAVQMAKQLGAYVVSLCSTNNMEWVKGLGSDEVISYQDTALNTLNQQFDLVYDVAATSHFSVCKPLLNAGGTYLSNIASLTSIIMSVIKPIVPSTWKHASHAWVRPNGNDLQAIATWIEKEHPKSRIAQVLPIDNITQAHILSETSSSAGKIVLLP